MVKINWIQDTKVRAMAYDTAQLGYNTFSTNDFRQWRAVPILKKDSGSSNIDFARIKKEAEQITALRYPTTGLKNDT